MNPILADIVAIDVLKLNHSYVLGSSPDSGLALFVHGRAGKLDVMWTFRRVVPEGFSIISVEAPIPDPIGGFSWWNVKETKEDQAKQREESFLLLNGFISGAANYYGLNPIKRLAYGFSQGAALLSICMQRDPSDFDGVGLLAGFVFREPKIEGNLRPSVFIGHGTQDETVPIDKAKEGASYLKENGFPVEFHEEPVGHKVGSQTVRALKVWSESVPNRNV